MTAETTVKSGVSRYRWWMLFQVSVVEMFVAGAAWTVMPVLFQEISQPKDIGLGLSLIQLGAIWGILPLALALLSIPGGIAADRYGVRWVIGLGVILAAVAGALRGMSGSFTFLLVWMFLYGVGYAAIGANIPKFVGTWFESKELGMANGIVFSAYGIGGALAMQLGGSFFSSAVGGWRNVLYFLGAVSLAAGILWLATVPGSNNNGSDRVAPKNASGSQQALFHGLVVGFRMMDVWLLVICQVLFFGAWIGTLGYLPLYLVGKGMTKAVANGYVSTILYLFVVGASVVPIISDWLGTRKYVYVATVAVCGIALMLVPFVEGAALLAALIVLGFCAGGYVIPRIIPVEHPHIGVAFAGSVFGFIASMGFLGGFISPIVGNGIAVRAGGATAIIMWGSCYLLAALIFLFVTETHHKRAAKS